MALGLGSGARAATWTVGHGSAFDFQTLTSALAISTSTDSIRVASGTYNEASGEAFPIPISGSQIICRASLQDIPIIEGNGSVTTLLIPNAAMPRLEGLVITGGSGDAGGGIRITDSSPTLVDCSIRGNVARTGGGVFSLNSSPAFTRCSFEENRATGSNFGEGGGGCYCSSGNPVFESCRFVYNSGNGNQSSGGGVLLDGRAKLTGCLLAGNEGVGFGGGAWFQGGSTASRCIFTQNQAKFWGGGAYIYFSPTVVEDCLFTSNRAVGMGDGGGGLACDGEPGSTIQGCSFVGNYAQRAGGVICWRSSIAEFSNCLFGGNFGTAGGGIVCAMDAKPRFSFCTLLANRTVGRGGGLVSQESSLPTVDSCLFSGNYGFDITEVDKASDVAASTNLFFNNADGIFFDEGETPFYSVSQAQAVIPEFENNLGSDPLLPAPLSGTWSSDGVYSAQSFQTTLTDLSASWAGNQFAQKSILINPDETQHFHFAVVSNTSNTVTVWGDASLFSQAGKTYKIFDFRPGAGSPCIDSAALAGPGADLLGNLRPVDISGSGRDSTGNEYDIGAIEFQVPAPLPTATPSPTATEAAPTPTITSTPTPGLSNPRSDINQDGMVDEKDLLLLLEDFGKELELR
jgi:hypothetical protein